MAWMDWQRWTLRQVKFWELLSGFMHAWKYSCCLCFSFLLILSVTPFYSTSSTAFPSFSLSLPLSYLLSFPLSPSPYPSLFILFLFFTLPLSIFPFSVQFLAAFNYPLFFSLHSCHSSSFLFVLSTLSSCILFYLLPLLSSLPPFLYPFVHFLCPFVLFLCPCLSISVSVCLSVCLSLSLLPSLPCFFPSFAPTFSYVSVLCGTPSMQSLCVSSYRCSSNYIQSLPAIHYFSMMNPLVYASELHIYTGSTDLPTDFSSRRVFGIHWSKHTGNSIAQSLDWSLEWKFKQIPVSVVWRGVRDILHFVYIEYQLVMGYSLANGLKVVHCMQPWLPRMSGVQFHCTESVVLDQALA